MVTINHEALRSMKQLAVTHMTRPSQCNDHHRDHNGNDIGRKDNDDCDGYNDDEERRVKYEQLMKIRAPLFRNQLGNNSHMFLL